tara:strand:+ start:234 stop:422 length:189 start_codon:yes stop_codon:yes gene_type:complete
MSLLGVTLVHTVYFGDNSLEVGVWLTRIILVPKIAAPTVIHDVTLCHEHDVSKTRRDEWPRV